MGNELTKEKVKAHSEILLAGVIIYCFIMSLILFTMGYFITKLFAIPFTFIWVWYFLKDIDNR